MPLKKKEKKWNACCRSSKRRWKEELQKKPRNWMLLVAEEARQIGAVTEKVSITQVKTLTSPNKALTKHTLVNNLITNWVFQLNSDTLLRMKMMTFHWTSTSLMNSCRSSSNLRRITFLKSNVCKKVRMSSKTWDNWRKWEKVFALKKFQSLNSETTRKSKKSKTVLLKEITY